MKKFAILLFALASTVSANDKIIGGEFAEYKDYPFIVSVDRECGGTILNKEWIITAAHCAPFKRIFVGSNSLISRDMKTYEVEKTIIHPQSYTRHDDVVVYDVALLKLKTPIDFEATGASPISEIADLTFEDNGWQDPGTLTTVLGWGATNLYPPRTSQYLKKLEVPIVGHNVANAPYAYDGDVYEDNMIPAGFRNGGQDACYGDSGGPLVTVHPETGKHVLVGVVSWGEDCAKPNKFGIYAKVSYFAQWVRNTIK